MFLKRHQYLKVFLTFVLRFDLVRFFFCYLVGYGGVITNTNKKKTNTAVRSTKKMNWIVDCVFSIILSLALNAQSATNYHYNEILMLKFIHKG